MMVRAINNISILLFLLLRCEGTSRVDTLHRESDIPYTDRTLFISIEMKTYSFFG